MHLDFVRQILEKSSNIKFHQNPSFGSRVVSFGQIDGHDEANSRFSQFCERAQKRKNTLRALCDNDLQLKSALQLYLTELREVLMRCDMKITTMKSKVM